MPSQNPLTRIEIVARDLGRLAEELGDYAGPNARIALLHWQRELIAAAEDVQRMTGSRATDDAVTRP